MVKRSFADLSARFGPWKILWGSIAGLSTVLGVLAFVGPVWGLILLLAYVAATAAILLNLEREQHRLTARDLANARRHLRDLRAHIFAHLQAPETNLVWRDEITVSPAGDAHWVGYLRIRADGPRRLHFFETILSGEPLSQQEQDVLKANLTVREGPAGARLLTDVDWKGPTEARVWTYLARPLDPGEEIEIVMEHTWPHTLPEIAKGGVETMSWACARPTARLEFVLLFEPKGHPGRELLFTGSGLAPGSLVQKAEGRHWRIEGSAVNLAQGEEVSLRLDAGDPPAGRP